jgi:hypothetical protein
MAIPQLDHIRLTLQTNSIPVLTLIGMDLADWVEQPAPQALIPTLQDLTHRILPTKLTLALILTMTGREESELLVRPVRPVRLSKVAIPITPLESTTTKKDMELRIQQDQQVPILVM